MLIALVAAAALVAGLTGSWSPCGFSMVETLAPQGYAGRLRTTLAACLTFTAGAATTGGGNWLTVTPSSGTTPANLSISANGSALAVGTYTGVVTVVMPGVSNSPLTIQVTLTVAAPQTLSVLPAALNFTYQIGGATQPASQVVAVSGNGGTPP